MKIKIVSLLLIATFLLPMLLLAGCSNSPEVTSEEPKASEEVPEDIPKGSDDSSDDGDKEYVPPVSSIKDLVPTNGNKLKIAFIGDSITQGTGTSNQPIESYPGQLQSLMGWTNYTIGNFGQAGAYTLDANNKYNVWSSKPELSYRRTSKYTESKAFNPDVVVIMLGVNDMLSMTCDAAKADLKKALVSLALEYKEMESVQRVYIATSIWIPYASSITQISDGELARIQKEAAAEVGCEVIDIFSMTHDYMNVMMHTTADRIHPTKEMYGEMARTFRAALLGEEHNPIVPTKSSSGVVYLKAGGRGDGSSPERPVGTLPAAVGLLRDGGGTIVVCGVYSLPYEMHTPVHEGTITVTSKYGGVDYQASGARLGLANNLFLYGDFVFKDIEIRNEVTATINCQYNNVTFDTGITTSVNAGVTVDPIIVVGYTIGTAGAPIDYISLHGECNVTVNSGKWAYINGGNRRLIGNQPLGTSDSDAKLNITINGGEFTYSGITVVCAVGMNNFAGESNFTVNGGKFHANIYGLSRVGTNSTTTPAKMTGTINMTINGGEFNGKIIHHQENTTSITGNINITIASKYESIISGFTNVTKK